MRDIIDYAGLFPPAQLSLEVAFRNYVSYLEGHDHWALSHFVIPLSMLDDLVALWREDYRGLNTLLSVLLSPPLSPPGVGEKFLSYVKDSLEKVMGFSDKLGVTINSFEIKVPAIFLDLSSETLADTLDRSCDIFSEFTSTPSTVFYELPLDANYERNFGRFLPVIQKVESSSHSDHLFSGIKIRTGGMERNLFPAPHVLSRVIQLCSASGLKMKATAGLHKPFYHYDPSLDVWRYGFVNVFAAAMLTRRFGLARQLITEILTDSEPSHFRFDSKFGWKNFSVEIDELKELRRDVVSFGSCDFLEPLDEMRKIGLL